ncbi:LysR family transcriptional regulator [Veronia nyctiphanis]|uniref:LysR family transcriptional regulator n=1 Tax=Veronia nyctiphanis TaxID=1278244 RepID=A0A4Q0YUV3_9GAMM|nr:LysR substrate-binding domain-containing protein [Veronia nyctiphanis]RXJ73964.1 LysR family transcriptional regulator [Veronia nyctiphanis]
MLKNLNLLVTFECAARHRSYSLAADELFISQAAVSQQMRQLEKSLGRTLFVRRNRQMMLTQEGETLLESAEAGLKILNEGIQKVYKQDISGELIISSTQAFNALWLMPRLRRFNAIYPHISIKAVSSPVFDDLQQSHIDLAIRFGMNVEEQTPASLNCDYFGTDHAFPICSPYLVEQLSLSVPEDLNSAHLITLDSPGRYSWAEWFEGIGVVGSTDGNNMTTVSSTDMALSAVLSGMGVMLSVAYLCQKQLESGELVVPFDVPHPNVVNRYFVYHPLSPKLSRLKIFMTWLKAEMTE